MKIPFCSVLSLVLLAAAPGAFAAGNVRDVYLYWGFGDGTDFKAATANGKSLPHPNPRLQAWVGDASGGPVQVTASEGDFLRIWLLNASNSNTVGFKISANGAVLAETSVRPVNADYGAASPARLWTTAYTPPDKGVACDGEAADAKPRGYVCLTVPGMPVAMGTRQPLTLAIVSSWGGSINGRSAQSQLVIIPDL